jgi:hypothetical protein
MHVINDFHNLRVTKLVLDQPRKAANIVQIPKKAGAEDVSDFRPISIIHPIAKYIAKMMAS